MELIILVIMTFAGSFIFTLVNVLIDNSKQQSRKIKSDAQEKVECEKFNRENENRNFLIG